MLVLVADLEGEGEWREHYRYEAEAHIPAERPQGLSFWGSDAPRPGCAASSRGRQAWEHGGSQRAGLRGSRLSGYHYRGALPAGQVRSRPRTLR